MNKLITTLLATFAAGWLASAADDTTNSVPEAAPADTTASDTANNAPATNTPPETVAAPEETAAPAVVDTNLAVGTTPTNGLVLNFHDAPLSSVLNYLSAKAGLIIMSDADLKGKVSIVAKQPVSTNEIVGVLAEQLARNSYAVTLNGRTLTIMTSKDAKTYGLTPVVPFHGSPTNIPVNEEIVTEIIPVHTLVPAQLVKDLEQLIPSGDTVTANEAGSAIIMTASQKDVHRIAEIITDLDSSAFSDVKVFPLKFGDAKSVASELKEIFQSADSDITRANTRNNFASRAGRGGGGFPGFGGFPGGGGGGGNSSSDDSKNAQTHAVFTSDDQMNAVIASAPPDYMPTISNVVVQLDQPSQDITEIRVFRLKHADPTEIADELSNLFPTTSSSSGQTRNMGFQFGRGPFGGGFGGFGGGGGGNNQSARMKQQSTVLAVADRRTQSVVVTAAKDIMTEIKGMIAELDDGPQGVQHVFAYDIDSADPASVQETMTTIFGGTQSRTQTTTTTALSARTTANNNSQSSTTSTTSGFGTSGSSSGLR